MNERARIDAILDSDESWSDGDWRPVSERFRRARERAGLSFQEIGDLLEAEPSNFWDLELYDEEVFTVLSVNEIARLAQFVKLNLHEWLFGLKSDEIPGPRSALARVSEGIARVLHDGTATRDEQEDHLDLDVGLIVDDPSSLLDLRIHEFRDVCIAAGIDWLTVLPVEEADV